MNTNSFRVTHDKKIHTTQVMILHQIFLEEDPIRILIR